MKKKHEQAVRLLAMALIPLFTSACVNRIDDETTGLTPGEVPIEISTNILCAQSRAGTNEQFDVDDAIGLYALAEWGEMNGARYIDNMRFTCTSAGMTPDEEVFYPADNQKCNFIGYYPYRESAIAAGESTLKVAVRPNQSTPEAYGASDFMVARVDGVSASTKSVKLDFQHKLCQLNIVLQLTAGDDLQKAKENATVVVSGACTEATYDFGADALTSPDNAQDIVPHGEWIINSDAKKLTGKKVLLIPQTSSQCRISLRINGRTFSSALPDDLILESHTSSEVVLHYDAKVGIGRLETSISEWTEGNSKDVTLGEEESGNFIRIAGLNFGETGVHQIVTASGAVIGEMCLEYLLGTNIDGQAIVLYPAYAKNKGTVLQLLNTSANVHGGTVAWDVSRNSFEYTPGSSAPVTRIYADFDESIVFEEPASLQLITAVGRKLSDRRGTETISYPIVKIGTQYWMGQDLKATKYNDGSAITKLIDRSKTTAGYFAEGGHCFYNRGAVVKGTLAPKGWIIPTESEWEKLNSYVNNTVAVLKGGDRWEPWQGIDKATNETGFNAQPVGIFGKEKEGSSSVHDFIDKHVIYWKMDNAQQGIAENAFMVRYDDNCMRVAKHNEYNGYSVRCVRE